MSRILPRVKASLPGLLEGLNSKNYYGIHPNWRIAITSTDASDAYCTNAVVDSNDSDPLFRLSQAIDNLGVGSEDARPLLKATGALDPKCGWRHIGAPTGIMFISDEDVRNPGEMTAKLPTLPKSFLVPRLGFAPNSLYPRIVGASFQERSL